MKQLTEITVFIASPGDVTGEREVVRKVCREVGDDDLVRRNLWLAINPVGWEDRFPAPGRPQEIINQC